MDPQFDVNALIKTLAGVAEFVVFVRANQGAGLTYNLAARDEFVANNLGTQAELDTLEQGYGIALIADVSEAEIDAAAAKLQTAFQGDRWGRILRLPDARILATVFLKGESLATGDLQLFKRARDLGLPASFLGSGQALARALAYVPRLVAIPGGP